MDFEKYGLTFSSVKVEDATFIYELRTNEKLALYLSATSAKIEDQENWIRGYEEREKKGLEFYFLCHQENDKYGLNRIYDLTNETFEIGSWIFKEHLNESIPILGDLAVRSFGYSILTSEKKYCTFNVRKKNVKVLRYHKMFKPEIVSEDEENFFFKLSEENFNIQKQKLLKILGYDNNK
jgi:hypothetical protein